ncbi:hypothetical protein RND81_09G164200 [Saponaria officinalis]|uniref:Uncharacterized protein n=1 Tax=Saponaria officinalis TaxID=3572 RepID=A0AAW1IMU8_SAPOF
MASTWLGVLQRIWPASSLYDSEKDLKVSNSLVNKLRIPDSTKQFVFAIQDTQTKAVIYILYVHGLSEKSAADTKYLIKAVRPDAVISDWSWGYNINHDFGDSQNEPIPTSVFKVVKQCFLYRTNKDRYQNVARNCLLQEIFGVGYERHHIVAMKTAEEIGSSFLMGSPRYFKVKPVEVEKRVDLKYEVPSFAENLSPLFTFWSLPSVKKLLLDVDIGGNVDHRDLSRAKFFELSAEMKSQYLIAQGIRAQTGKYKKIVVVTGQDDWTGIGTFWNAPHFQETEGMIGKLYVSKEDSGVEFSSLEGNDRIERRPLGLAAGGTASLVASVVFRKKKFIRIAKTGIMSWFAFAGFAAWLQYGDAIASLPAAPGIARLGRGIQSLQRASQTIRHSQETRINEHKNYENKFYEN